MLKSKKTHTERDREIGVGWVIMRVLSQTVVVIFLLASFTTRPGQCCRPDARGEEGVAWCSETARACREPIRAAERKERTTMGHQGITYR